MRSTIAEVVIWIAVLSLLTMALAVHAAHASKSAIGLGSSHNVPHLGKYGGSALALAATTMDGPALEWWSTEMARLSHRR